MNGSEEERKTRQLTKDSDDLIQTAREDDENLSGSTSEGKNNTLEDYGYLMMKLGRFMAVLFFVVSSLLVYILDDIVNALIVLLALGFSVAILTYTEYLQRELMGIDKKTAQLLAFTSFKGPLQKNVLYFPNWIRFGPVILGAAGAIVFTFIAIVRAEGFYEIILGVVTFLCAAMSPGSGNVIVIALGNGVVHLKQQDIDFINIEKFGVCGAANFIYADKSLFQNDKNPDISSIYIDGEFKSISALSYDRHASLIFGFNLCDDGELGRGYGFSGKIGDGLIRVMRTTPLEHRALFQSKTYSHKSYTEEDGYASVTYRSHKGEILNCVAGKPEKLLPHLTKMPTKWELRDIDKSYEKRLRKALEQIYASGKQAVMMAEGIVGETLTFMGYIIISAQIVENASEAVSKLKDEGINITYVSDENAACAYYKAKNLGLTHEMSQVLTGTRIEKFKPENLVRAASHATLAAEMDSEHRKILAKILKKLGHTVIGASKRKDDGVFEGAQITMGTDANIEYPVDISIKSPKITNIVELSNAVKIASSAAKRALHNLMFAPLSLAGSMLFCLLFTGFIPYYISAVALFVLFFSLFQTLNISASKEGFAKTTYFAPDIHTIYGKGGKNGNKDILPGKDLSLWLVFSAMFAALSSTYIFAGYYPETSLGIPAASCAAYMALFLCMMTNGLIMRTWGQPLVSIFSGSKRKILVLTAILTAVVFALFRVDSICRLFKFGVIPYKQIPATFLPAIITLFVYGVFSIIKRKVLVKLTHA